LKLTRIVIAHRPETIARADRQINFNQLNLPTSGARSG
jgi:ABC-type bacteriocin/lantibiotic exporter with double-glycine peptidase domain